MPQEYNISRDGELHIAHHRDDPLNDVRIDTEWTQEKDDEIYAPWEELVAAILTKDITQHVDISSHHQMGSVGLSKAAKNLVNKVEQIENEQHAKALIETLRQEDIVEEEDGEVILFQNISAEEAENAKYLYNWAAAMQLIRTKIEDQIQRAKELDEQLQEDLENIGNIGEEFVKEDPQKQIERLKQQFNALGDGEGVPDPSTLSPEERREYNQYKRTLQIARARKRIQESYTIEGGEETDFDMQGEIENFQHLQQAFTEYEKQLRTIIRTNKWRHSDVGTMLDGLVDMVGNIAMLDQTMDDMSHEDIQATFDELTESKDQAYDAGSNVTDGVQDEDVEEAVENQTREEFAESFHN